MKEELDEHVRLSDEKVVNYKKKTAEERKRLREQQDDLLSFISSTPDHEVVKQFKEKASQLEASTKLNCKELQLESFKKYVFRTGMLGNKSVRM